MTQTINTNPYVEIRFLDKNNIQTKYCKWHLARNRSAVFKGGLLTTYHFTTYQLVQCIEHTADHLTLVVRDI